MLGEKAVTPQRIQRRRTKGWRMPEGAICVSRPSPWGNPFVIGQHGTAAECVALHRHLLANRLCISSKVSLDEQVRHLDYAKAHIDDLIGHSLACWCRLCPDHKAGKPFTLKCDTCQPCHADNLLEAAARREAPA